MPTSEITEFTRHLGHYLGTPDIALDANPYTGVWVFVSLTTDFPTWFILGGTSVSSPIWAGIVNSAGSFSAFRICLPSLIVH